MISRVERVSPQQFLVAVPVAERTIFVELLAEYLTLAFDRFARDGDEGAMLAWVARTCTTHGDAPGVATLFASAFASRASTRALARSVAPILARSTTVAEPSDRLGEIDAAINDLVVRLDRSDELSAEHSRAVAAWCTRLARRLSLSDDETTYVTRAGLVHDVGKTTTPPEILHAPRRLTDAEFDVMREHTTAGERIVRADPRLASFGIATRSHHERVDGRGYPDRLKGDDLPLAVRIVTVADCFNAMIGRRPYRAPMLPAFALDELDRGRGTQFDHDVVSAMHDVIASRFERKSGREPGGPKP